MASQRDAQKEYRTDQIAVSWEAEYCIHSANCIRGVPAVFNPRDRPWVHVDAAPADEIARVIMTCPTGALHFERLDGGPAEPVPETTIITSVPNGPLYVRGNVEVRSATGQLIRRDTRLALCRCGHSQHQPFCDNSHREVGFVAPGEPLEPTSTKRLSDKGS